MKKIHYLIIFLNIAIMACSPMGKQKKEEIVHSQDFREIDINGEIRKIDNIGEYIDSTKYIPLETNEKSLIVEITRLEYVRDTFIIFDKPGNSILIFDSKGKFLHKIGRVGKGPNEYSSIRCIAIEENKRRIFLFDQQRFSLLEFDFSGNQVSAYEYDGLFPSAFYVQDSTFFFFQNKLNYDRNYFDIICMKGMEITKQLLPFDKKDQQWFSPKYPFYSFENKLMYVSNWETKILELGDSLRIKYSFNLGEDRLPLEHTKDRESFLRNKKGYSYFLGDIFENDNYLCFSINKKSKFLTCLYSKKDSGLFSIETTGKDWINRIPVIFAFPKFSKENYFISSIEPQNCLILKEMSDRIKDKSILNVAEEVNINSNPILAIYYFNKN